MSIIVTSLEGIKLWILGLYCKLHKLKCSFSAVGANLLEHSCFHRATNVLMKILQAFLYNVDKVVGDDWDRVCWFRKWLEVGLKGA